MERSRCDGGGVRLVFIETQYVTSDAAGFKSLVQRLTSNAAAAAPLPPLQRPRGEGRRCHGGAASASASSGVVGRRPAVPAPACVEELLYETCDDLDEMFCVDVDAGGWRYGDFPC
ncbi:hypothetical protein GUJ93_ZPchr0002g24127 [Zizania palustris]|uniref:VQ domain-containing protein n=1 Tax=Zizania palustris TaxID=103762 RepID=A0A8J5RFT5_ZIZPA|nr:hypothetical protein GUJ93_ZPchr0002g24127 [Zizania palustris]